MNRIIKFRAWDVLTKQMVYPDFIKSDGRAIWGTNEFARISDIVMQWAGVRDKSGKDIYEGDICTIKHKKGYGYTWVIEYIRMGFIARAIDRPPNSPMISSAAKFISELEVIGDIYTTPELLTK